MRHPTNLDTDDQQQLTVAEGFAEYRHHCLTT
jgi:hypothetical protein